MCRITAEETRINAYIEIWYNKKRRCKALKNLSIDEFWDKYNTKVCINLYKM